MLGGRLALITMPLDALSFRNHKCFGISFWLTCFLKTCYDSFFGEFPESHGDTIDDEHRFSSLDGRSVRENHPDVRGHATGMRLGSYG